jgi:zinc protease
MKKYIVFLTFCFLCLTQVFSQIDRSIVPAPGPAPLVNIGKYESFSLRNGLKVFVVENHKLPKVSFSLAFDYDNVLQKENCGYVEITGNLIGTATKSRTKAQIDEQIDYLGATFSASERAVNASSLKKHIEPLMDILSDVVLNASFKQEELDKIKKQTISGLAASKSEPGSISDRVSKPLTFGNNHPYGENETEASVNNVSLLICNEFYKTYFRPNVSYLAIVGDINVSEAKVLVEKYFGKWQKANVPSHSFVLPAAPVKPIIAVVDRPVSVQSIITVGYPLNYSPSSSDYLKAQVMNTILGGGVYRLFVNLREKHGWTYGSYSRLTGRRIGGNFVAFADVRNSVTDSATQEILNEMKRLKTETVSEEELQRVKNSMSGEFSLSLENPQTIANFAINIDRYKLPKDYYENYLKALNAVTSADVREMAQKYMMPENSIILVVGKADEIAEKLMKFCANAEINFYDADGNKLDKNGKELPKGITGQDVIDQYISAIGGKSALEEMKDVTVKMKTTVQGMALEVTTYQTAKGQYLYEMKMNGNVMAKVIYDGKEAKSDGVGGAKMLEGTELDMIKEQAVLNPELHYAELGYKLKLKSIEAIEGKACYVLEITSPSGKVENDYFDKTSGLKVKSVSTQNSPQGVIEQTSIFQDYRGVEKGIKYPFKILQSFGPQNMEANIELIEINKGLADDLFKVK